MDNSHEEGIVTQIYLHNPANPIEEHGMIEFRCTNPGKCKWLKVGDLEHYVEYNWQDFLEVTG